jgi:MFS family permease
MSGSVDRLRPVVATEVASPPTAARRSTVAWPAVLVTTGLMLALLLLLAGRYGPHRDELYFVAAGHHLAWGYPDQPALTPLIARVATAIVPGSVVALHVPAALAMAAFVVLAALTAHELGGGAAAQALTAAATATGAVTVALGHFLSTATTDALFGAAICYVAARALQRDEPRHWLVVGLIGGVGLENKHLVAFLLGALVVGILFVPGARHHLRSPWAWGGAALAVALWVPNLVWQATHGWPQLTLANDIRAEYLTLAERLNFVLLLLVILSPVASAVWIYGLVRLFRAPSLVRARPFAWAFVVLTLAFFVTGGKGYYLTGILPVLLAAGCVGLAERWTPKALLVTGVVLALAGMVVWPAFLPILSARAFGDTFFSGLGEDQAEMVGWPREVALVDRVARDTGAAVIVAQNYGEAGALDFYGAPVPVYSGHNAFGDWGPPPDGTAPFVLVGYAQAPSWAQGCRQVGTVDNGVGVDDEEQGHVVMVCAGPKGSWSSVWKDVKHLSA